MIETRMEQKPPEQVETPSADVWNSIQAEEFVFKMVKGFRGYLIKVKDAGGKKKPPKRSRSKSVV